MTARGGRTDARLPGSPGCQRAAGTASGQESRHRPDYRECGARPTGQGRWFRARAKFSNTANRPGLPWFDAIPATWDESRTLDGAIGQYVAVARRKGATWYLGAMTNESARTLSLPLSFLGSGIWTATVYADGTPGTYAYQTPVVVSTRTVTSATVLSVPWPPRAARRCC
ncbi:glycoside hydrolase family 97 C-terminal domain-containing protein [Streptomyces sp. Ru72]|uniref:glycoside hydrolase family 97 C-terminal domain-containing protein n=1 Tax=Streptomyces sp. Ru72 TaxID=2080747 RepID=UPI002156224B|nr:glycoside hydrolase family 97 C-terminal domain-containing protein [Streptomyces sp. Ru72]